MTVVLDFFIFKRVLTKNRLKVKISSCDFNDLIKIFNDEKNITVLKNSVN